MKNPSDKYEITGIAGNASRRKFNRVFFGIRKSDGKKVVIKSLEKTLENNHIQQRLKEESQFSFSFSGLPEVLNFFETEKELMLVLAFQNGIPLGEFAKTLKQKQKPEFILSLLKKLQPILAELHEKQILHLDIKPGNIVINGTPADFEASLIDFGMAKYMHNTTERKTLFPLGYAAPELILNRLQLADQRTDLFALGITNWQLFTGKIPLLHPNPSITTNLQLTHPLPEHDLVPGKYFRILKKMTNKHSFVKPPNHYSAEETNTFLQQGISGRYSTTGQVITDWEIALKKKNWFGF